MPKLIDLKGKTFGAWYVIKRGENKNNRVMWICRCGLCGRIVDVSAANLMSGGSKSCGCEHSQMLGNLMRKHGMKHTRLYTIWTSMKARCYYNGNSQKNYKDKGITICNEWLHDFSCFHKWAMNNGYSDNLTIDRIDNSKGYSPENCRWATPLEQGLNTSRTLKVLDESQNKYYSCTQIAKRLKLSTTTVARYWRRSKNKTLKEIINLRVEAYKKHFSRLIPIEKTNVKKYLR